MARITVNYTNLHWLAIPRNLLILLHVLRVGSALSDAIDAYELGDKMQFRRLQCNFSQYMIRLCTDLKTKKELLQENMPVNLQCVLKNKRPCLFHKLLVECDYSDAKVATEMGEGFPLCGWLAESGVFSPKNVAASGFACGRAGYDECLF